MKKIKICLHLFFLLLLGLPFVSCHSRYWENRRWIEEARQLILSGKADCVLIANGKLLAQHSGRGVNPLMAFYQDMPDTMRGAILVDRVIGRAAAAIAVSGGVSQVYGLVISRDAIEFLDEHNVQSGGDEVVDQILNRDRSGRCPLELSVAELNDPALMVAALKNKIASFKVPVN